jgi:hypothetical protein
MTLLERYQEPSGGRKLYVSRDDEGYFTDAGRDRDIDEFDSGVDYLCAIRNAFTFSRTASPQPKEIMRLGNSSA